MKKFIFVLCFVLCIGGLCFADSRDVDVLINKKVKVTYDEEIQEFQNVNGERVYPITYADTTYLPIRAISSLFDMEIKWDGETRSVYLGEGELDENSSKVADEFIEGENETATVRLDEDIKIYFDGDVQSFADVNGNTVYPLSYNGTTYLPVRAVSNLFGLVIDWDGTTNTVIIKSEDDEEFSEEVYEDSEILVEGDEYDDEEFEEYDDEDDLELLDDEDAIEVYDEDFSYVDVDGREIFYYFDDEGDAYYYYFDDDNILVNFYYDEDDERMYYYYFDDNDDVVNFYYDDDGNIVYFEEFED